MITALACGGVLLFGRATFLSAQQQAPVASSLYSDEKTGLVQWERWLDIPGGAALKQFTSSPKYGAYPDDIRDLTSLVTPENTGTRYASRIRGYVHIPRDGSYVFWVAADDTAGFWISPDERAGNKVLQAYVPDRKWTGRYEWTKFDSQHSAPMSLHAGQKLYFEILNRQSDGPDHLEAAWQIDGGATEVISGQYLSSFPDADQDEIPDTFQVQMAQAVAARGGAAPGAPVRKILPGGDETDNGLTNYEKYMLGLDPLSATTGEIPGVILWEKWFNITGPVTIASLTGAAAFPDHPGMMGYLENLAIPADQGSNYGTRLRGYLHVPETADYTFSVSSDDCSQFFLSSDDHPENKQLIASVPNNSWTKPNEWNKYPQQRSQALHLQAGAKLYFELLHRQQGRTDHAAVAWEWAGSKRQIIAGRYLSAFPWDKAENPNHQLIPMQTWSEVKGADLRPWIGSAQFLQGNDRISYLPALAYHDISGNPSAARIQGFLVPPASGSYTFFISGNQQAEFWLGTGESEFSKVLTARAPTQTRDRQWNVFKEQQSGPVNLVAGQRYYFEVQHKGTKGINHFAVAWQGPGQKQPEVIDSQYIARWQGDPDDLDYDGLPDSWERTHFPDKGLKVVPQMDEDGDGLTNYQEAQFGSDPNRVDSGHDGIGDYVKYYLAKTPDAAAPLALLTQSDPWSLQTVGRVEHQEAEHLGDGYVLCSDAWRIGYFADSSSLLQQTVSGDFEITAKVNIPLQMGVGTWAGLMLRKTPDANAPMAAILVNNHGSVRFNYRSFAGEKGPTYTQQLDLNLNSLWLKLRRNGQEVRVYHSEDGTTWKLAGRAIVDMSASVVAGPSLNAQDGIRAVAVYHNLALNTNPAPIDDSAEAGVDSDGDGVPDIEEMQETFTDPHTADLKVIPKVSLSSDAAKTISGTWEQQGGALVNDSQAGAVDYTFNLDQEGIYRFEFDAHQSGGRTPTTQFELDVQIDGNPVGTLNFTAGYDKTVTPRLYTPWLKAGGHTVRIILRDYEVFNRIAIEAVRFMQIQGADENNNHIDDWEEQRLAAQNEIIAPETCPTSPACIEGVAPNMGGIQVKGGAVVRPAPNGRWYANVPLALNKSTRITVSFENGAYTTQADVSWAETDIFDDDNARVSVRRGDSLKLTAKPPGDNVGDIAVTITANNNPGQSVSAYTLQKGVPVAQEFDLAGDFTVTATPLGNPAAAKSMVVHVMDSRFGPPPAAWTEKEQTWVIPGLAPDAKVEADSRLYFAELAQDSSGARRFQFVTSDRDPRYVAARVDAEGPILDTAGITGVDIASSNQTYVRTVSMLPDGTRVVETSIIVSSLNPGMTFQIHIAVAGVVFEDGTLDKTLTAADFDASGQAKIRFLVTDTSRTSVCHSLTVFQDGKMIGKR